MLAEGARLVLMRTGPVRNLFGRFRDLKVVSVENGSAWIHLEDLASLDEHQVERFLRGNARGLLGLGGRPEGPPAAPSLDSGNARLA